MPNTKSTFTKRLEDTARHWFVRIQDDDVDIEEINQWQNWLDAAPQNAAAYEKVVAAWEASDAIVTDTVWNGLEESADNDEDDSYDGNVSVMEHLESTARKKANIQIWQKSARLLSLTAALVTISLVTINEYYSGSGLEETSINATAETFIRTNRAEHHTAKMSDGSLIEVGAMSKVSVDYSPTKRSIWLEEGEAFFEVASDADRPFVVTTPLGNVTAIGTAFNIKLSNDRIVVTVTEGEVKMDVSRDNAIRLDEGLENDFIAAGVIAGEAVLYTENTGLEIEHTAPLKENISWRNKNLGYRTETLKYVISDLQRYSNLKFKITDPRVASMQYSGTVRPDKIDKWLKALPEAFPIEIQTINDVVIIRYREAV